MEWRGTDSYQVLSKTHVDWRNREAVRQFFNEVKPEVVIHCAAKVGGVKANKENPVEFMLENLAMQNNVIEAAHDSGVEKLCFIATSCMFPRDAVLPVSESSLFTGRLEDSVEAYAIAKIAGWRLCKAYWEQYGNNFITIAPSNLYGQNDNYGPDAHVIPALIRRFHEAIKNKIPLEVWGDGSAVREFIFADDVAAAIRVLLEHWKSPEVVNVGTGAATDIKELISAIAVASPHDSIPEIKWDSTAPTGIPRKTYCIEKLSALGWKPKTSLREGLKATWADFLTGKARGM
jgi:GDP-L-fucose synthase